MFPIPRLYLAGIGLALILALAGGLYLKGRHDAAEKAKAAVAAAQSGQKRAEDVAAALDTYATQTIVIKEREARGVQIVQQAAGAETPIPDPVRRAWLDGLGVRDNPASDNADSPPGSPGTLPPT